jgi:ribose/xylose/arabinose/galactoside ABC-type transport system permease subunit
MLHFLDLSDIHARAARARSRARLVRVALLITALGLSTLCGSLVGILAARADLPHLITIGILVLLAGITWIVLTSNREPFRF